MKKLASLLVLATFALAGVSHAQTPKPTAGDQDSPFGGPLAHNRPKPAATPPPDAPAGKKMVGDVTLSTDDKGKSVTTSFAGSTPVIYLQAKKVSGAKGDKIRVDWIAEDTGKGLKKGQRFQNSTVELPDVGSHDPNFHVEGPINGKFPAGKYHADVFLGSEKFKTVKFTVQ